MSTVCDTSPTSIATSTDVVVEALTVTLSTLAILNPAFSTRILYVPTGNAGMVYLPPLVVTAVDVMFVAVLVAVTVAPAITAPFLSVTSPVTTPRSDCPKTNGASSSVSIAAQSDFKLILVICISKENILEGREEKRARRSQNFVTLRAPRGWKSFERLPQVACGVARLRFFPS